MNNYRLVAVKITLQKVSYQFSRPMSHKTTIIKTKALKCSFCFSVTSEKALFDEIFFSLYVVHTFLPSSLWQTTVIYVVALEEAKDKNHLKEKVTPESLLPYCFRL